MNLSQDVKVFINNLFVKFPAYVVCAYLFVKSIMHYYFKPKSTLKEEIPAKAHGILFGKNGRKVVYSPTDSEGHIAVFGGSGLGKTSALLIPTLQHWNGTSFSIDIAGDICSKVDMPNKMIYEPANFRSIPYNIFASIDCLKTETERNQALEQLAFLLMPDDINSSDSGRFFQTEGRKILTASLIAFYNLGMDFIPIMEKIVYNNWKNLFNEIDNTKNTKATQYINSFEGASEQNTAGCKQACDGAIKLFATNDIIKKTIRRPEKKEVSFSPEMLEKYNVFVVIEDSKLKLYSPLLQIITAQSLDFFSNRSNQSETTILFCLDEFSSLGKMDITDALRKLRKKHIRIMMLTQSMADVDLIYGKDERMAMMNNYKYKVVLGADDTDTQEYFAKLIGYKSTTKTSTSKNAKTTTHTQTETKDFAIEPSDLARLGEDLILLHPDGYSKLKKNYYYKDSHHLSLFN